MTGKETNTVAAFGQIAASGTSNVSIPVPSGADKLIITVAANYAANAATSGLTAALSYSPDGVNYTSSSRASKTSPNATGVQTMTFELGMSDMATRADEGAIEDYKVSLTNTDATNAVAYYVAYTFV